MALPNIFHKNVAEKLVTRIQSLSAQTPSKWGKMSLDQMLAHCNVSYELVFEDKHPKPGILMKLILKAMVKKHVINEIPYPINSRTAPSFIVNGTKDFELERNRLITYITQCLELGEAYFEGKTSHSFGALNASEWSNMFYKHLDHHLKQFNA